MTGEKEKMLSGELYDPEKDGLPEERAWCKELCQEYNSVATADLERRSEIIRTLLGGTGDGFLIEQPFWCNYGTNIRIGERFYSNHNLVILDCAAVVFGNDVKIGPNCGFYAVSHPLNPRLRRTGAEFARPITVGSNVWFGGGVTVLPGVSIGENAVIGAGSVVTRDIPPGSVAVGNPCRPIGPVIPLDI
jgi:acetyltransferase-like isoleucine patch superfamily enzyme